MNDKVDWQYLFLETRARVYLLWAAIATLGFVATHYYQNKFINIYWAFISVLGLYYMYKVMPMKVKQMRHIFLGWFITIGLGMVISGIIFYLDLVPAGFLIGHLGGFWLLIMAQAYFGNGYFDKPAKWYYFAGILNMVFGILCLTVDAFIPGQYLIAAVISAWSMLFLWVFRTYQ